ncbi:TolC family protein [Fibrivirga algicola]|uniref:TolC family protein n=1 Tax=Fibrivirga algicola TaxID=2950420 RepID=A0ABX0QKP8_9BACT|nr:TolC family protein [Fibrivirga algicola]NID11428.1 TolC family protein [Fibrivirga algicola]
MKTTLQKHTIRRFVPALWLAISWLGAATPGTLLAQVPAASTPTGSVPTQPSVGQQPTGAAASGQQPGAQQPAATGAISPSGQATVPSQPGTLPAGATQPGIQNTPVNLQSGNISTFNSGLAPAPTGLKPANQQGDGQRFSMQEAIDFAIKQNINVRNSQLDAVSAEARILEIKASALPQVSVNGSFTDNLIIQRAFLPAVFFDPKASPDAPAVPVQFGVNYAGNATASVNQLLYSASLNVGLRAAATYRELAQRTTQATKVTVAEQVAKAYYGVLVARERSKLLDLNIGRLDTLLRDTRASNQQGFVEKLDVQRLEVQANNLRAERQNVENLIQLSYALLKYQMGLSVNDEITLTEQLQDRNLTELESLIAPDPTFQYQSRIEYSTLQTQLKLAELDIEGSKKGYYPTVSAFVNYGYNNGKNRIGDMVTTPWLNFSTAGLSVQIPIFDGFLKKYQIAQKRVTLQKAQNSGELLKNSIDLQIRQSSITLNNGFQTLQTQLRNRDLAQEIVRVTRIKYKEGVGSNIEVLNAETSFREAQTNYFASLYDFLIAKVDQDKALGRLYTGQ